MRELIEENNFEALKEALENSNSSLKIHHILFRILNNEIVEEKDYGFEANVYQEEFFEGFGIYKALNKSNVSQSQFQEYKSALILLVFKLGGFTKLMADTAMRKGVYLSQIEDVYKVNPALRGEVQNFIDLLKETNDVKAIANVAAAKAQISLSIGNLLTKSEIGQDMLQFATGYEDAGLKDQAVQLYQNILKDFECEAVKLSSGLFPEITYVDTRPFEEIEIYEKAKRRFETLTGKSLPEIKRTHVDVDANAKAVVEKVNNHQINTDNDEQESPGFWSKFKKRFT